MEHSSSPSRDCAPSMTATTTVTRHHTPKSSSHSRQASGTSSTILFDQQAGLGLQLGDDDYLKTELQLRDAKIRELEYQCEAYKSKERDIQSFQAANANLERRLDLLSRELIHGLSPSRRQSTQASDQAQCPSPEFRRRSTFPKLPVLYPSVPQTPILTNNGADSEVLPAMLSLRRTGTEPISPTRTRQQRQNPRPFFNRSPNSTPANSRPNSLLFSPSFKGPIWEKPLEPTEGTDAGNRTSRPMRKFVSGSNTLKPLVLPAKSNRQSLPLSAPTGAAFLPFPDSPQASTRPSTAEAHKQALQALEGRPESAIEPQASDQNFAHVTEVAPEELHQGSPPMIGLEPPSSAGTAFQNHAGPTDTFKTLKWLPLSHFEPTKICEHCVEPPLRQQLRTWYRTSVSVLLSIELALRNGPETMINALRAQNGPPNTTNETNIPKSGDAAAGAASSKNKANKQESARTSKTMETNFDSGYEENS